MIYHLRDRCRGCDGSRLVRFLELGPQPLANALPRSAEDFAKEPRFPLDLWFCPECSLVQVLDVIDPEVLFGHYLYVTGTSATMAGHNHSYAAAVKSHLALTPTDRVVEVASNDGSLLAEFQKLGHLVLGIEPARNIAALANTRGILTVNRFFGADAARELRLELGGSRVAIANNVLAHVDDTRGFLKGLATLVQPEGMVVVEAPYLGEFIRKLEYDTVYHEHLCYFSITALSRLYRDAGLSLRRIDHVPVHGGSLRLWATPVRAGHEHHSTEVLKAMDQERAAGFHELAVYLHFAEKVSDNRRRLLNLLRERRAAGRRIAAYGAPAKGNTLLNYCGISPDLVEFTVDKNPLKIGRYLPGQHQPILDVSAIEERRPDDLLILPWNLADEIMRQESAFRARGGQFIIPIPEPVVK